MSDRIITTILLLLSILFVGCWSTSDSIVIFPEYSEQGTDASAVTNQKESIVLKGHSPPLAWISHPGGSFEMGGADYSDEAPIHEVTLKAFSMLKTEVTVGQYRICVNAEECTIPEECGSLSSWREGTLAKTPVNCVSHDQAWEFCQFAGGRLPSEAEWEYAAGGVAGTAYPWGDEEPSCDLAIMSADEDGDVETAWGCERVNVDLVCSKTLGNTSFGLCDMAGNLFEWVADTYHETYEDAPENGEAWVDESNENYTYVIRGGAFYSTATSLAVTRRGFSNSPGTDIGFRCARSR